MIPSATDRGYGIEHQRERKRVAQEVEAGQAYCCECGWPIAPGSRWHLAHDHYNGGYRGAAHARCNVAERNKRHARRRSRRRDSRVW
jgi:hypothetical protein